jgi:hydroxyethylthiazole kinase
MDIMANTLLAAGASPAMVHAVEEITEFTALSNALCINIGTLSPDWIFSMKVMMNAENP